MAAESSTQFKFMSPCFLFVGQISSLLFEYLLLFIYPCIVECAIYTCHFSSGGKYFSWREIFSLIFIFPCSYLLRFLFKITYQFDKCLAKLVPLENIPYSLKKNFFHFQVSHFFFCHSFWWRFMSCYIRTSPVVYFHLLLILSPLFNLY